MAPEQLFSTDEEVRLRTLRHQDILESLHESIFDAFVRLTAHIFNSPISLISVTDAAETVYIAHQGLAGLTRQPSSESICSLVVREGKAVVYTDLTQPIAPRLAAGILAAARSRGLQFYAGVPLRMPNQCSIGTLCVIDQQPRTFSTQEQLALEQVAALIARIIVVRSHCRLSQPGEEYWQKVQTMLVEEVSALDSLVQHVVTHSEARALASSRLLEPIMQRLQEVNALLDNYSYGKP